MSKRNISRRQAFRIQRKQAERAARAQRSDEAASDALGSGDLGPEILGRVIARYGQQADVLTSDGQCHRCFLRSNLGSVVAGDDVAFHRGEETGVIVAREARRTELRRPDKFGKVRSVAANIDQVVIVIAPLPEPYANLIDRYLVATENLGAEAIILLNKADMLSDGGLSRQMEGLLEPYAPLGYEVVRSQGKTGALEELTALLAGRTSILVGQSGVGKTTLVNALLPNAEQAVGDLSPDRNKGRHTTTTARLFELPGNGSLIDSPGIREFGLWHMQRADVERGFREFSERIGQCRFRDCTHEGEPGCALELAAREGLIHPARLDSYRRIVASLDEFEID